MKKISILTVFLFLGFLTNSFCKSRTDSISDNKALQSILEISSSQFLLGENIVIRHYLKNNTEKEILICAWPTKKVNYLVYYDGDKKTVIKDEAIFKEPVSYQDSFVSIKPKSKTFYGTIEYSDEYFVKAGKWKIYFISYYEFTGEKYGIEGWHGRIESNTLNIKIKAENRRK
jgi:hypothetical protein